MNVQLFQRGEDAYPVLKVEENLIFNIPESFGCGTGAEKGRLWSLLEELVGKTRASGGLLIFHKSCNRNTIRVGHDQIDLQLTPVDERLLKWGKVYMRRGWYIQPVQNKQETVGIICIKCNDKRCLTSCKNLVHAYSLLVAQEIEMDNKEKLSSVFGQALQNKKRELEEVQQYNENLLSITAHDLASPLNAVMGYLEMIEDFLTNNESKHKLQHYFRRVQSGVNDMTDMLMQLNEIIKFKEGELTLQAARVDANWVVGDVCDLLRPVAYKKGIELHVISAEVPAYIDVDVIKFKRVIYNLVSNAIKYTGEKQCVTIDICSNKNFVEVHVKDKGKGIAEDKIKTIFQPFVKLKSSEEDIFSKGLGLYISSYFVELMNGTIETKSKPGEGSTFTISIPEASAPGLQNKSA